jgi:hypothetical protein
MLPAGRVRQRPALPARSVNTKVAVPERKRKKPASVRKRNPKATSEASAAPKYTPWDSPETLASVKDRTANVAASWHFIAACTRNEIAHEAARARQAILDAVVIGDAACLRDLAGRAAKHLARQSGTTGVSFKAARSAAFDQFHSMVAGYLQPLWAPPNAARKAIPSEEIARHMISIGRGLPEVRHMLARYRPELFSLTEVPGPVPDLWISKIVAAVNRKRDVGDPGEAAEEMIVQFLLTVGVPEVKARAVWDYRKKRAKRGS